MFQGDKVCAQTSAALKILIFALCLDGYVDCITVLWEAEFSSQ